MLLARNLLQDYTLFGGRILKRIGLQSSRGGPVLPAGTGERSIGRRLLVTSAMILASSLALTSCSSGSGPGESFPDEPASVVQILVDNHSWEIVHVYIDVGGQRTSAGQVSPSGHLEYELSGSLDAAGRRELRLVANAVGMQNWFISDPVGFQPGDTIQWTLRNPLTISSVIVR